MKTPIWFGKTTGGKYIWVDVSQVDALVGMSATVLKLYLRGGQTLDIEASAEDIDNVIAMWHASVAARHAQPGDEVTITV